jgi:hypothetical protein
MKAQAGHKTTHREGSVHLACSGACIGLSFLQGLAEEVLLALSLTALELERRCVRLLLAFQSILRLPARTRR